MSIIAWLILGAIAGYLAGFLVKGDEGLGVIGHVVLGIVGALVGGFLFQAVRELLWNVVKHARTTEATLSVSSDDKAVYVVIEDNGVGFKRSKGNPLPTEQGGYGLFSIAERIDLLGGRLELETAPRKGTRVTLVAPIDPVVPRSQS